MKREFYYQDDRSNKFWTIELDGTECISTHGRVGARAREMRRQFDDGEEAKREFEKQIASKLKKGYIEGQPPEYKVPDWPSLSMSEDTFWRIIRLFNWKKLGDDDAVVEPAVKALAQMSVDNIKRFEDILHEKLHALDTEAHAREIGEEAYQPGKYFSVDWFLYERCAVVANGREVFERILGDPTEMPKDMEFEALLTVATTAYEREAGEQFDHVSPVSYETYSNQAGWRNLPGIEDRAEQGPD
jgi:predicted DNA-binding WGR domain protein